MSQLPSSKRVSKHYVEGGFGQIHFRTCGQANQKPALVCLHMVSKSSRSFHTIMPFLAEDRLVVAIDYPGYGESDPPDSEDQATIANYAREVIPVINELEIEKADFVGYHTGCMVSVEVAMQYPERVNKIVNFGAPIFTQKEIIDFKRYFSPIPLDEAGTRFKIMWERIMFYRGPGMTLEMAASSMAENLRGGDKYEWGHMAAFNHSQRYADDIGKLRQPFLVMNIGDDLYEHSRRVDELINIGERIDYPDWGTGFLDVFPKDIAHALLTFFDGP